jgi:hypothetical protein
LGAEGAGDAARLLGQSSSRDLALGLLGAGATIHNERHDPDDGFVAAQLGDRFASVDIFRGDGDVLVANIYAGDVGRASPGDEPVQVRSPGPGFVDQVLGLLREVAP